MPQPNPTTLIIAGGFDVLHKGHRRFIKNGVKQFVSSYNQTPKRIVVRLIPDEVLNEAKGKYRPFFSYSWRRRDISTFLKQEFKNIECWILPLFIKPNIYKKAQKGKWEDFLSDFLQAIEITNKQMTVIQFPEWLEKAYSLCIKKGYNCQLVPETPNIHTSDFLTNLLKAETMSKCNQRKVGAILIRNGQLIDVASNGPLKRDTCIFCPKHMACRVGGRYLSRYVPCIHEHAERRVLKKAKHGDYLFVTTSPCRECAKEIIKKRIARVVFLDEYPDPYPLYLFQKSRILYRKAGL